MHSIPLFYVPLMNANDVTEILLKLLNFIYLTYAYLGNCELELVRKRNTKATNKLVNFNLFLHKRMEDLVTMLAIQIKNRWNQ